MFTAYSMDGRESRFATLFSILFSTGNSNLNENNQKNNTKQSQNTAEVNVLTYLRSHHLPGSCVT